MSERLTVGVAARLSRYLQVLTQAKKMGRSSISSQDVSRVHAHQRDADPARPLGLREVRQARRRLQHRRADRRDPRDPAHVRAAQHRADRRGPPRSARSPARRSSPTTASTSSRSSTTTRRRSARELARRRDPLDRRARPRRWPSTTSSPPCIAVPAGAAQTVADQLVAGRRAHHLQLLRGAPADARGRDRAQLQPRSRAPARALLLPHVGVRARTPAGARRASARRPSRRPRAAPNAMSGTAHSPVDQPTAQAMRQEKEVRPPRALHASRIGRSLAASVERMRWYARGDGPEHPRPACGARRGARITSTARRISPSRSRRSSRSSTPRRTASSTASPSSRRAPTRRRSASTRRAS